MRIADLASTRGALLLHFHAEPLHVEADKRLRDGYQSKVVKAARKQRRQQSSLRIH